jgi:hypothetical protein
MASSMKSVEVIQKVKILPRATASHQPGSETRWREETNVRSRVEQVSRVCIEPRKLFESRGPARDNHPRRPDPRVWEPRTVSRRWNAVSAPSLRARQGGGHRGRRPDHADTGRTRERVRASAASCLYNRGAVQRQVRCGESTARPKLPPERPAAPPGRSLSQNAGTTGTEGQAGTQRTSGGAVGSLSGAE